MNLRICRLELGMYRPYPYTALPSVTVGDKCADIKQTLWIFCGTKSFFFVTDKNPLKNLRLVANNNKLMYTVFVLCSWNRSREIVGSLCTKITKLTFLLVRNKFVLRQWIRNLSLQLQLCNTDILFCNN